MSIVAVLALLYVAFAAFLYVGLNVITSRGKDYQLDAHLECRIATEIPVGTHRAQVATWLMTNGANNVAYQSRKHIEAAYITNNSKFKPNQISGITTFDLEAGDSLLGNHSTYVDFFFDKKGRLIGDHIERHGIGL